MSDRNEALRQRFGEQAPAIAQVLATQAGQRMIEALEDEFFRVDERGKEDRELQFNAGARAVVNYLHDMVKVAKRLGDKP